MRDYETISKHTHKEADKLFRRLAPIRKDMLAVSREFYPLGVAGWSRSVETLADRAFHDDDHRLLTTQPVTIARRAAAGLLQNLTSKGQSWFYLSVPRTLRDGMNRERKEALEKLTEGSRNLMSRGNAYSSIYRLFLHYIVYGFGCMLVSKAEKGSGDIIDCKTLRPGTYALGIGTNGRVNSVARKFAWTPLEIVKNFGVRNTPKWIKEAARSGAERLIVVWNLIEPTAVGELKSYDPVSVACDLGDECRWRSIYWVQGDGEGDPRRGILSVTGFEINPIIAPRIDCELGDTYGRGLGIDGLDLARGLQSVRFDYLKGSGDQVQPAIVASAELKEEGLSMERGAVNYVRPGAQIEGLVYPVLRQQPNLDATRNCEIILRQELETLFYIDAFTAMDLFRDNIGKVTATQINYAKAEGMQKLGAMVSNCEVEFLNVLVNTIWRWAVKAMVAPIDLKTISIIAGIEREVAPEYVSNIHQARRLSEMNGIQAWVQNVALTREAKGDPINDPADVINADVVNQRIGEILNVPVECMVDEKKIASLRSARSKAAASEKQVEMLDKGAGAINKVGNTPVTEDRLLAPLARAATGLGVA